MADKPGASGGHMTVGDWRRASKSLCPSRQMRQPSRWLSFPLEPLLRVLALLDGQELMTVRLVCRDWDETALSCITHLNLNQWLDRTCLEGSSSACTNLTSCLRSLPNLSHLTYNISGSNQALLLSVPSCSMALKALEVDFWSLRWHLVSDAQRSNPLGLLELEAAPVAHLTGLTSLQAVEAPLRNCVTTIDQVLRDHFLAFSVQALTVCKGLRKLVLSKCEDRDWIQLLPLLAGLPHLAALGSVSLDNQDVMALVVPLTGLTAIQGSTSDDSGSDVYVQPLLELRALRALHVDTVTDSDLPALIQVARGTPQLAELVLELCDGDGIDPSQLGSLLAPLPGLTKLELWTDYFSEVQHHLWQACLGNLRHMDWSLAGVSGGRTVTFPSSLQHLRLIFDLKEDIPGVPGLFTSVADMTGLTALSLSMTGSPLGWSSDGRANEEWRKATFLTGLTRLVHLKLDHILHVANVEVDVACLATLTTLRTLSLHASCSCHKYDEGEYCDGDEGPDDWKFCPCGFKAFRRRGGFLPLLCLAGVKQLDVSGSWRALKGFRFEAALNSVQEGLGRPPVKVGEGIYAHS